MRGTGRLGVTQGLGFTPRLGRARHLPALGLAWFLATACATHAITHPVPVTLPTNATLAGELYTPSGPGPFPTVILLHGCSGIHANMTAWAVWLTSEGYAAFVLDSFSGRGIRNLCGDSSRLTGGLRSNDVFATVAYLRSLAIVDRERIGAMGFSHGGWTTLWVGSYERRYPESRPKAMVAFYPFCGDVSAYRGSAPLLMLLGAQDDWTPAEPCRLIAEAARQEGRTASAVVYPNAGHGFDGAHIRGRVFIPQARRGQGATVWYDPQVHADSEKQVRQFLRDHLR